MKKHVILKNNQRTIVQIPHYIDDMMRRNTEWENEIQVQSYINTELQFYERKETLTSGTTLWIYHDKEVN